MKCIIKTKQDFFFFKVGNWSTAGSWVGTRVRLKLSCLLRRSFQLNKESDHTRLNLIWKNLGQGRRRSSRSSRSRVGRTEGLWVFLVCDLDSLVQININSLLSDNFAISLDSSKPASYHENSQQTLLMSPPEVVIIREVPYMVKRALKWISENISY